MDTKRTLGIVSQIVRLNFVASDKTHFKLISSNKNILLDTHKKHLMAALVMSTTNVCFRGEMYVFVEK